jgi:hypothetical protein
MMSAERSDPGGHDRGTMPNVPSRPLDRMSPTAVQVNVGTQLVVIGGFPGTGKRAVWRPCLLMI